MILTICISPCIDVDIEVDSLSVGMLHKIINKRVFYSGKSLNVAIGLSRLGAQAFTTGFMYEDNGKLFEQELHREGVAYKFVWNTGRVRENYKFIDKRSMLTEVDDISPEVSKSKQQELVDLVANLSQSSEALVLSGGIAKGMSAQYYGELLKNVAPTCKKVVDSEGERLLSALSCGLDLVKPNLEELQSTLNIKITTRQEMLKACYTLLDKGAKRVLLSLGKQGAIITDGTKSYFCKSVQVAMNSTLGAGDGMVAAATNALVHGEPLQEILRQGVAAGSAAITSADSLSFFKEKYDEILQTLKVNEI